MVLQIQHNDFKEILKEYYENKVSLMAYGTYGIGKSRVIKDVAKEKAKEKSKEFVEWNSVTEEKKLKLFDSPEKYFVFIDIRLSEYDSSDIKGLPVFMDNNRAIDFKVPLWALYLENEKSDGILFFDEITLAVPLVLSSCYKIVLDRCVNQSRINDNWFIMMAGNRTEDKAYAIELPSPLKDRCGEIELQIPSIESWTKWAIDNHIDSRLIGFLNFKPSNLMKVDDEDNQKYTTPRGYERLSGLIENIDNKNRDKLQLISSTAIGEGVASEFVAFCKLQDKVNMKEIIKNPNKIKEMGEDLGIKYFVITSLADWYKEDKANFKDVMKITKVLDEIDNPEFVALLWRLCLSYKPEFEKEFLKGDTIDISGKYLKYLK